MAEAFLAINRREVERWYRPVLLSLPGYFPCSKHLPAVVARQAPLPLGLGGINDPLWLRPARLAVEPQTCTDAFCSALCRLPVQTRLELGLPL